MEFLAVALAIGLPALLVPIGQGWAAQKAMDAIWRQPEAADQVRPLLLISLAFMEAIAIYGLLIAVLLLFVG